MVEDWGKFGGGGKFFSDQGPFCWEVLGPRGGKGGNGPLREEMLTGQLPGERGWAKPRSVGGDFLI